MEFKIRQATALDMVHVHELINELALFEKEEDAVEITVDDLIRDGYTDEKLFYCFVAQINKGIVGAALVYPRYSTWKGPVLHLEDLIVTENYRGSGIGNALLTEVVKYAHQLGVKRISWEVLDWNDPAIAFYQKKGANVMREWNVVQLNEQGIKDFLGKN